MKRPLWPWILIGLVSVVGLIEFLQGEIQLRDHWYAIPLLACYWYIFIYHKPKIHLDSTEGKVVSLEAYKKKREQAPQEEGWVTLLRTSDRTSVFVAQSLLESRSIPTRINHAQVSNFFPNLTSFTMDLCVPAPFAETARKILIKHELTTPIDENNGT